jgi:hypothetical protein
MLVNPTLVYAEQGAPIEAQASRWRFAARIGLGFTVLMLQGALVVALPALGLGYDAGDIRFTTVQGYGVFVLMLYGQLLGTYASHSAVASLQIGAMGLLGWRLPERYRYPLFATSPLDLWRRWNIYLGHWLQRYVFLPLALRWQGRLPARQRRFAKGGAVLATFALCGGFHEAVGYSRNNALPLGTCIGFVLCALSVMAWATALPLLRRLGDHYRLAQSRAFAVAGTITSAVLFCNVMLIVGWFMLPALAGLGLPEPALRILLPTR